MSGYRNISITFTFSLLVHFAIFYFSPFYLAADIPKNKEVKVVFKIQKKSKQKALRPINRNVKKMEPKRPAKAFSPYKQQIKSVNQTKIKSNMVRQKKLINRVMIAQATIKPVRILERRSMSVRHINKTVLELPPDHAQDTTEDDWAKFKALVISKIERKKVYPNTARKMGIQGNVLVRFTILPNGHVSDIEILSDVNPHKLLKKAAEKTIKKASPYLPVPTHLIKGRGIRMKVTIAYKIT